MLGANLRFGGSLLVGNQTNSSLLCHPGGQTGATIIIVLGTAGIGTNLFLMILILIRGSLRQ